MKPHACASLVFVAGAVVAFSPPVGAEAVKTHTGAPFGPIVARPALPVVSCDFAEPVCVHAAAGAPTEVVVGARVSLARAWSLVIETLGDLPPLRDDDGRFDLYLAAPASFPDDPVPDAPYRVRRDARDLLVDHDGAPAFAIVDPALVARGGCALDFATAQIVAEASAFGADLAATRAVVEGFSAYLADLAAPCPGPARDRFAHFEAEPWRSIVATPTGPEVFASYLDGRLGGGYGQLVPALFSTASDRRPIFDDDPDYGPAHFDDDPSVFDVISASFGDVGGSLDDALLGAAAARFLDGNPRPFAEWSIPASTLPRNLLIGHPIEPTGVAYLRVDLDRAPKSGEIDFDLFWDAGARMRWRVLKLDAQGRDLGGPGVGALDHAHEQAISVRNLKDARSLVLIGLNAGVPSRPWRPDDPPSISHGFVVLVSEPEE